MKISLGDSLGMFGNALICTSAYKLYEGSSSLVERSSINVKRNVLAPALGFGLGMICKSFSESK